MIVVLLYVVVGVAAITAVGGVVARWVEVDGVVVGVATALVGGEAEGVALVEVEVAEVEVATLS